MSYRNRRIVIVGATVIAAAALSGCATPKHTNLLVFGTNTVVGLKVGADATQTPSIQLAYSRQELVLMPLLANTSGQGANLTPCPATESPAIPAPGCKFVGEAGTTNKDSYSVLASFGARGEASGSTTNPKAGGAIAQYFATGLAARVLATHGSSLVAASESATTEARAQAILGSPKVKKAIQDELNDAEDQFARIKTLRAQISGVMLTSADPKSLVAKLDKSLSGGAARTNFATACGLAPAAVNCAQSIQNSAALDGMDPDDWEAAAKAANE